MRCRTSTVALELIQYGVARIVDWSANYLDSAQIVEYRNSEMDAKTHHRKLWKDWVATEREFH